MTPPTFRHFVEGMWKADCYDRCKPSTRLRMDSALRTQLLPTFGSRRLDRICRESVHQWFDLYSLTAPAGANRTMDVLRQIFNHAVACGYVDTNPTRDVRRNPRPKQNRFLSRTEIDRLHAALDAHRGRGSGKQQAEIIRLLLLTGCRKSEIMHLRWSEVHGDSLQLTDSKTGPRTVILNTQARTVLARQPRTSSVYVFPSLTDSSRRRSEELSLWRKVRQVARIGDVRLHDLRHTFASHAVMKSVPLPVVSRMLGHTQSRMTMRYAHVSDRETEAAAERIGGAISVLLVSSDQAAQEPEARQNAKDSSVVDKGAEKPVTATTGPSLTPNCAGAMLPQDMETVNALELRQSLGKVLDQLERGGEPILVCRRQTPAAALVSLKDYRERFVDREADDQRRKAVDRIRQLKFESPVAGTTLDILRDLRS